MKWDIVLTVDIVVAALFSENLLELPTFFCTERGSGRQISKNIFGPDIDFFIFITGLWHVNSPVQIPSDCTIT